MARWLIAVGLGAAVVAASASAQNTVSGRDAPANAMDAPRLLVGDPAPALSIGEWIKGGPVNVEKGTIYVVDFWATWCVPCMESMPHSSELSRTYRDKGVQFIAVTAGDKNNTIERVRRVVAERGEAMDFAVAFDDGRRTTEAFRMAARRSGIPVCFVIDRAGVLAWVGHPADLDAPLEQIVAGSWDLAESRKAHAAAVEAYDLERRLLREYESAKKEKRWDDAVRLAEQIRPLTPRLSFVIGDTAEFLLAKGDGAGTTAYATRCVNDIARDNAPALGRVARAMAGAKGVPGCDLDVALKCAERAVAITPQSPWAQHSVALVHRARGDLKAAIEAQRRAVALAKDDAETLPDMEAALRELDAQK